MRKKVISLLLCASLALTMLIPSGLIASADYPDTPVTANGLVLSKTATSNGDGSYKIRMEAYTTGDVTTTTSTVPTDFVLVLDQSGSMNTKFGTDVSYIPCSGNNQDMYDDFYSYDNLYVFVGGIYQKVIVEYNNKKGINTYTYSYEVDSNGKKDKFNIGSSNDDDGAPPTSCIFYRQHNRLDALKNAANSFVDSVYTNASTNKLTGINHRISVVSYSNSATTNITLQNGDVLANKASIKSAISGLSADGGTMIDSGLANANTQFNANSITSGQTRNRVVVVFTDGVPGTGSWTDDRGNLNQTTINCANNAISNSYTLKHTYGAKVYSIGMFTNINPADANTNAETTNHFSSLTSDQKTNRFLHYISSNYPNAVGSFDASGNPSNTSIGDSGTGGSKSAGYYLVAADTTALNNVFQQISTTTLTPTITLGADTEVRDIISPYFKLPDGTNESNISISTANYNGSSSWSTSTPVTSGISASISGKTISITGFDFTSNFVTDTAKPGNSACPYGKKLIIEFNVVLDGTYCAFGGNSIPTNMPASGVYPRDAVDPIATFAVPKVDIPINYNFSTQNQSIYISRNADLSNMFSATTAADGKNNAFVNILYTIKQGGNTVGTYTINAGDTMGSWSGSSTVAPTEDSTNYTVECKVTPNSKNTKGEDIVSTTISPSNPLATVYVFKPTITAKDTWKNFGTTVNLNDNIDSVTWSNTIPDAPTPTSSMPTLTCEYKNIEKNSTIADATIYTANGVSNFNITKVKADSTDITSFAAITSSTCNTNSEDHSSGRNFTIHMNKFNLEINKKVDGLEPIDQVFIIKVKGNGQTYNVTISPDDFKGGRTATKTIVGLYCGTNYTVKEDGNWSWRYTANNEPQTGTETTNGETKSVNITNTRTNNKWLSGEAEAENIFESGWSNFISIFD